MKRNEKGELIITPNDYDVAKKLMMYSFSLAQEAIPHKKFEKKEDVEKYIHDRALELILMFYPKELIREFSVKFDDNSPNIVMNCDLYEGAVMAREATNRIPMEFSVNLALKQPQTPQPPQQSNSEPETQA